MKPEALWAWNADIGSLYGVVRVLAKVTATSCFSILQGGRGRFQVGVPFVLKKGCHAIADFAL